MLTNKAGILTASSIALIILAISLGCYKTGPIMFFAILMRRVTNSQPRFIPKSPLPPLHFKIMTAQHPAKAILFTASQPR